MKSNVRGAILALCAFGVYATHDMIIKLFGADYSPVQILFFAVLMGFPIVTIMLMADHEVDHLRPHHPWWTVIRTVMTTITGISAFYAFVSLPLTQTYAILFASPLVITVLAIPILGEKVGIRRWAAVVVGLGGVLVVLRPGQADLSLGHLAAVTAAVASAAVAVILRKVGHAERSAVLLLYPMVAHFVIMGAALAWFYEPMPVAHLGGFAVMALLGFVGSLLIIAAYRAAEAVVVAPMQFSQILWASGYGYFLFGEGVDLYTAVGAGIIIASGVYIVLREGRSKASANRPVLAVAGRSDTGTGARSSILSRLRLRPGGAGR